jgi:hypothetical protein
MFLKGTFLTNDDCVMVCFCSKAFFTVSEDVAGCWAIAKIELTKKASKRNLNLDMLVGFKNRKINAS